MPGGVEGGEADTEVGCDPTHDDVSDPLVEQHVKERRVCRVAVIPEPAVAVHAAIHS